MKTPLPCSDVKVLERFVLGMLSPQQSEPLAAHVETCDSCVTTLDGLKAQDSLVEILGTPDQNVAEPPTSLVVQVAERLAAATRSPAPTPGQVVARNPDDDTLTLDENARRRFESAWAAGQPAPLERFLPAEDHPAYLATLEELVAIELEFQWRRWSEDASQAPPTLETYLARFAGLNRPDIVRRLVEEDARVRRRYGQPAGPEDYRARFPGVDLSGLEIEPAERSLLAPPQQPGEMGRLGPYRVLNVLGAGGMGIVYRAENPQLQRLVALKVMKPGLAERPDARQRFLREARVAAFNHDHIVSIFQVGEDRGVPYLAMPFLEGETLDDRLQREGQISVKQVLRIGREIADGLAAAHERGLIHRDIKPGNVWLEPRGSKSEVRDERAKIMDFGLARPVAVDARVTQSGEVVGSPAFMAPEQARGEEVDARADLFSLGCLLYRACTGRLPFQAKDPTSTLVAVVMDTPVPPREVQPEVPAALSDLILKLLAKKPADRPASAGAVAAALQDLEVGATFGSQQTRIDQTLPATPLQGTPGRSRPGRRLLVATLLLAAGLGGALYFAPMIYRFATNQGDLVVEADDPDVEVAVKQGNVIIRPRSKDREFLVRAGKGVLEVYRPGETEALVMKEFKLARGGKTLVTIQLDEKAAARPIPKDKPGEPLADREKPFVVVRAGSKETVEASTLGRALALLEDGDVIEVHGNGPFQVGPLTLQDKGLTLRAVPGYRPQIRAVLAHQQALFAGINRPVLVEGCDFRSLGDWTTILFAGGSAPWEFKNCRFLLNDGAVVGYQGPRLRFADCLVCISIGGLSAWMDIGPGKTEVEIVNCILAARSGSYANQALLPLGKGCDWKVLLRHNTIYTTVALLPNLAEIPDARADVEATGNIFQINDRHLNNLLEAAVFSWKDKVQWRGSHNLYVGSKQTLALLLDKDGKKKSSGLAGWEEFWGKKEEGSREALLFHPAWRTLAAARNPRELVQALQPLTESLRRQSGLARLGPDWDLVGPGEGYVRALAAEGKPVAQDKLRPKPVDGAPFVVLRKGQVATACDTLDRGLAAARDGDIVEIRTDDPTPAPGMPPTVAPMTLTIRAAPGYLPVIEGSARWITPNLTLSVEDLHFSRGGLTLTGYEMTGKNARLARLANCSFDDASQQGWSHSSVGDVFSFFQTPGQKPVEIVNCLIPGTVHPLLEGGNKVVLRNSVCGPLGITERPGQGDLSLEIDRCFLWSPLDYRLVSTFFRHHGEAKDAAKVHFTVRDSLLDNVSMSNPFPPGMAGCTAERNVYRFGERRWYEENPAKGPGVTGLAEWKNLWKSDADSIQLDPALYDPRQWLLLPGSPGSRQGPGGKDMGADVSRIGTTAPGKAEPAAKP